jgi:hypothetical protein
VDAAPLNAVIVAQRSAEPACLRFDAACKPASYHNFQFPVHIMLFLSHRVSLDSLQALASSNLFLFSCGRKENWNAFSARMKATTRPHGTRSPTGTTCAGDRGSGPTAPRSPAADAISSKPRCRATQIPARFACAARRLILARHAANGKNLGVPELAVPRIPQRRQKLRRWIPRLLFSQLQGG